MGVNELILNHMKLLVKERKAKATYTCVYKREEPYFWYFTVKMGHGGKYLVNIYIKLSQYDEFVTAITCPDGHSHFTDKLRYEGFYAMKPYAICNLEIEAPITYPVITVDTERLQPWCEEIYHDAVKRIDDFICMVKTEHGNLNQFFIDNANTDPLMAAFAYLYSGDYLSAVKLLEIAKERSLTFGRLFGSFDRDLRDVLLDYCKAKGMGVEWTRDMVLSGL